MMSATYDPADNKLRLYPTTRLAAETYARVKAAGFRWAPRQELFVAPMWTPAREDLLRELCGEIGDEDTSLVERAEERAERFEDYSASRTQDAEQARAGVDHIADQIPLGQPILVGHHSERHARRDQERIHQGMARTVQMWERAEYWERRAHAALQHAKYKEHPAVRARRIKGLEADLRKQERHKVDTEKFLQLWRTLDGADQALDLARAKSIANFDHLHLPEGHAWGWSLWSALDTGTCTAAEARDYAMAAHQASLPHCQRWIDHYTNRITYERAMLEADGGTVADRTKPEKGGACKCWVKRGQWVEIVKVNKVSVTVMDNWDNGGPDFPRTIPFDKLSAVLSQADYEAYKAGGERPAARNAAQPAGAQSPCRTEGARP